MEPCRPLPPKAAVTRFLFGTTPLVSMASLLSPVKRRQVTVCGEKGTVIIDDAAERKLTLYGGDGALSYPPYDDERPLTRELRAFLEVLRTGVADRPHAEEGAAITRMIAAAELSAGTAGRAVAL